MSPLVGLSSIICIAIICSMFSGCYKILREMFPLNQSPVLLLYYILPYQNHVDHTHLYHIHLYYNHLDHIHVHHNQLNDLLFLIKLYLY